MAQYPTNSFNYPGGYYQPAFQGSPWYGPAVYTGPSYRGRGARGRGRGGGKKENLRRASSADGRSAEPEVPQKPAVPKRSASCDVVFLPGPGHASYNMFSSLIDSCWNTLTPELNIDETVFQLVKNSKDIKGFDNISRDFILATLALCKRPNATAVQFNKAHFISNTYCKQPSTGNALAILQMDKVFKDRKINNSDFLQKVEISNGVEVFNGEVYRPLDSCRWVIVFLPDGENHVSDEAKAKSIKKQEAFKEKLAKQAAEKQLKTEPSREAFKDKLAAAEKLLKVPKATGSSPLIQP